MMPNFSPNIRGILGGRSEVRTPWRAKQKNHDVSYSIIVKQPRRQQMFLSSCQWKLQPQGPSEVEVLTGPKVHQRSPPVLLGASLLSMYQLICISGDFGAVEVPIVASPFPLTFSVRYHQNKPQ